MKVTKTTTTRVELEEGDDAYELYEFLGELPGDWPVTGAIEIHEVTDD